MKKIVLSLVSVLSLLPLASCKESSDTEVRLSCDIVLGQKYYGQTCLEYRGGILTPSPFPDEDNYVKWDINTYDQDYEEVSIVFNEDFTGRMTQKYSYKTVYFEEYYSNPKDFKTMVYDYYVDFTWNCFSDGKLSIYSPSKDYHFSPEHTEYKTTYFWQTGFGDELIVSTSWGKFYSEEVLKKWEAFPTGESDS